MNVLGLRPVTHYVPAIFGGRCEDLTFLDFTIDGRSLGEVFPDSLENTALLADEHEFRTTNLRRLAGLPTPPPDFRPRFVEQSWLDRLLRRPREATAPYESAFEDGRIGLRYCACGDMDCGVLSAEVEFGPTQVWWRDVAHQTTYQPFAPGGKGEAARSFVFERQPYQDLFDRLLGADWSTGLPALA